MEKKQIELEAQGLKVEAGEIRRLGKRMEDVGRKLSSFQERQRHHRVAQQQRNGLLRQLRGNRDQLYGLRRSTLKGISEQANDGSLGLKVHVSFIRPGAAGGVDRLAACQVPIPFAARRSPRRDATSGATGSVVAH